MSHKGGGREVDVHPRIGVRAPYFALERLALAGDYGVAAEVPAEQERGLEADPIAGAEAGRHLAILGSCAVSRVNPREGLHYYLAERATLERLTVGPRRAAHLVGEAHAEILDRHRARARARLLTGEGEPLYSLDVEYRVLAARTFARLFSAAERSEGMVPTSDNPYARALHLDNVDVSVSAAYGELPSVDASQCSGHFPRYPVLPVAIVMRSLSDLAGAVLASRAGGRPVGYAVERAVVEADRFACAGERVRFVARHVESSGGAHVFDCRAEVAEDDPIGRMRLWLSASLDDLT
jgi:hypothetical protein